MVPAPVYQGNPFKPALNYKIVLFPKKKAPIHNFVVEFGQMMVGENNAAQDRLVDMRQRMQYKERSKSFKKSMAKNYSALVTSSKSKQETWICKQSRCGEICSKYLAHTPMEV